MPENPWLDRRVIAYAHQGGAKEAPSSTLYAIRRALEHGATGIELDVHATLDGELVVCHDPTLDRTTDSTGEIAEHCASTSFASSTTPIGSCPARTRCAAARPRTTC